MRGRIAVVVTLACGLAACQSDGTSPSEPLTQEEASALALALATTTGAPRLAAVAGETPDASQGSYSFTFDETWPCADGGAVRLAGTTSGSLDATTSTVQLQLDVAETFDACVVRLENGATLRLKGDPKIDLAASLAMAAGKLTAAYLRETGAFVWTKTSGESGRCTVDVSTTLTSGDQLQLSGSFCGFQVEELLPLPAPAVLATAPPSATLAPRFRPPHQPVTDGTS